MKNNWQKKLTISLACATFLTATSTSYASYNLNPEVKTATTALKTPLLSALKPLKIRICKTSKIKMLLL